MIGGLFNSKSKTQQTSNTTNTSITQDMSDNSVNDTINDYSQVTDISLSGQYAGVNTQGGNFTVTDGGAFGLVGDAINGVIDLTNSAVGNMASLADQGFKLAEGGFTLADSLTARSNNLAQSLAGYNADVARDSINSSTAITGALLDYASQESEQSRNLSENTTRYALQAVDSISRSDGQQLGIASLNTQKWLFVGLGVAVLGFAMMRGR